MVPTVLPLRTEVLRTLRESLPEFQTKFGLRSLMLFGSVARGEAGPESDVDLLVEFGGPVGVFRLAALRQALAERLGRAVDVGTVASLSPAVRERVLGEVVRIA